MTSKKKPVSGKGRRACSRELKKSDFYLSVKAFDGIRKTDAHRAAL